MQEFIKDVKQDLIDNTQIGDNYCIIVYCFRGSRFNTSRWVKFIYKTVDEFEVKFNPDDIDSGLGIDFELWLFD